MLLLLVWVLPILVVPGASTLILKPETWKELIEDEDFVFWKPLQLRTVDGGIYERDNKCGVGASCIYQNLSRCSEFLELESLPIKNEDHKQLYLVLYNSIRSGLVSQAENKHLCGRGCFRIFRRPIPPRFYGLFTRILELNGLLSAALCLLYSYLFLKDLPFFKQFVSFTRKFWNRVFNSLFDSVSMFWLPQMERNFGVSWKTGKRDEHFVLGNAIYNMVVVCVCCTLGLDIERGSKFIDGSVVIRILLLVLMYKHAWEIIKVSLICGSGFHSCKIPSGSSQFTGNNGNCHKILRSFARMYCKDGNMTDCFEMGRAMVIIHNIVNGHSNLFNVEDSKQNKEVKKFDHQSLLKLANDIETNPGPPYICIIQEFLDGNHEYRSQNKEKLFQTVSKLYKDTQEGKIPACMYTEQHLITLYNIFDVSIREKYPHKIMTDIENLSTHWNKEVRQEELRLRSEMKNKSELDIAINHHETTELNKQRENADNNPEQQVLQGQMIEQRKLKDGTRKGNQYKLKTSLVKKNRLHRGDWNPYGPKKNLELSERREPPI